MVSEEVKIIFKMLDEVTPALDRLRQTLQRHSASVNSLGGTYDKLSGKIVSRSALKALRTGMQNVTAVSKGINRDFGTTALLLRKMGYQVDHTTGGFRDFRGNLISTNRVIARAKGEMTRFRMEFLSVMFGAMQQVIFTGTPTTPQKPKNALNI